MALKKKPVTGMKDILPAEMAIRDYVIRLIKETYVLSVSHLSRLHAWSISKTCRANRVEKTKN